jgi:hypothetical protein
MNKTLNNKFQNIKKKKKKKKKREEEEQRFKEREKES